MAKAILVLGRSGTGKSTAIRTLNPEETFIISPDEQRLPFSGSSKMYKETMSTDEKGNPKFIGKDSNLRFTKSMKEIVDLLKKISLSKTAVKVIVIDTISHAQVESVFNRAKEENWSKFIDFAEEVRAIIKTVRSLREDLVVIINAHTDEIDTNGITIQRMKVPAGKLTREKLDPESLFDAVLEAGKFIKEKNEVEGYFITNGISSKSPMGMFENLTIPNDLKYVVDSVNAYYDGIKMPEQMSVKVVDKESF